MCCKRARPHKGRPTSLIRDIRDRASGGNQTYEASHPSRARPSEPNSTPPTGPAGLLMQPETASAINTGGPLHEAWMHRATFDLVWLGVLILTPGVGVPAGPVCPAFPLRFRLGLSAGGRVRPVGVVPGWPGTAGTRPAPTASAAEGASGGGGRSGPAEPGC